MKITHVYSTIALCFFFVIAGCQTASLYRQSGIVPENNLVSIAGDNGTRTWNGRDLSVDYTYSRKAGQMDLSGSVHFADKFAYGYGILRDFQLSAILADDKGKVLQTTSVVTNRGDFSPVPFHVSLTVPSSAVGMSFSYQGTAVGGGGTDGDGTLSFWQNPMR